MLVTFSSRSHADITLFGDVAKQLLSIIGHSGTIPGAIRPEDIPEALGKLQQALGDDQGDDQGDGHGDDDADDDKVPLSRRAWPLLQMLRAAHREDNMVMWDRYNG